MNQMKNLIDFYNEQSIDGEAVFRILQENSIITICPLETDQRMTMNFTVISKGNNAALSALSVKPQNAQFNISRMIEIIPNIIEMIFLEGKTTEPQVLLILLKGIIHVYNLIKVRLKYTDTLCLYSIWKSVNGARRISEDDAFKMVYNYMSDSGNEITREEFINSMNSLNDLGVIEIADGYILIKESVCFIER